MTIIDVNKKIKAAGYKSFIREMKTGSKISKYVMGGINDDDTNLKMDSVFQVYMEENNFQLTYANHQIAVEKVFTQIEDLIAFIKKQFPIG